MKRSAPIRTLIVDDSATIRRLIRQSLARHPDIEIVAEAGCARSARDAVNRHRPDVMTLDVEMPHMDGLEFLRRLMRARPMPVVMVSALTEKGSRAAVKALSLGAIECVAKPKRWKSDTGFEKLADSLRVAACAKVRGTQFVTRERDAAAPRYRFRHGIVLIGSSTGGVEALETILSEFPENCPPTLITQHMPEHFLKNFSERLDRKLAPVVKLGEDRETVEPGKVLIAPGGAFHMGLAAARGDRDGPARIALFRGPKRSGHRPSIDEMFLSARHLEKEAVAVLLTGMGSDGAQGILQLKKAGAFCIGQDRESCVVYGMPRVAWELGALDIQLPLNRIAEKILERTSARLADPGPPVRSADATGY